MLGDGPEGPPGYFPTAVSERGLSRDLQRSGGGYRTGGTARPRPQLAVLLSVARRPRDEEGGKEGRAESRNLLSGL